MRARHPVGRSFVILAVALGLLAGGATAEERDAAVAVGPQRVGEPPVQCDVALVRRGDHWYCQVTFLNDGTAHARVPRRPRGYRLDATKGTWRTGIASTDAGTEHINLAPGEGYIHQIKVERSPVPAGEYALEIILANKDRAWQPKPVVVTVREAER
jgi:hypothetical protein